jgi:hypothetical protein
VLDGEVHAFYGVADVVGLEGFGGAVGVAEAGSVFGGDAGGLLVSVLVVERGERTDTSWSRLPRAFIHSPIQVSDSPF